LQGSKGRLRTLLVFSATLLARDAIAADGDGFALQPFDPSAASDRFFAVSDATVPGDFAISGRADVQYAYKPLLSGRDPSTGESRDLVSNQLSVYLGGSIALDDTFLFGLTLPFVPTQGGDHADSPDGAALGDLDLYARFAVFDFGETLRLAPEIDLYVPTGSQEKLAGDGSFGAHARALLSGEDGLLVYGLNLGYLVRDPKVGPGYLVGPSTTFGLAFGVQLLEKRLQLAGELQGSTALNDEDGPLNGPTTPVFVLAGAKFRVADFVIGAAGGPSLTEALGNSPRALLTLGYVPRE
jgi:hypothetical protein